MFMLLFLGKVWGWLAEGRVEVLEQQTPANPYLFHTRLIASLVLYTFAAGNMFWYCLDEVIYEARPGVMIMFVFEWGIICIGAFSICCKYALWAYEQVVVKKQEIERREELRREAAASREAGQENAEIPEDELDVHDLDLPGWEAKGTWIFGLDIVIGRRTDKGNEKNTDFARLSQASGIHGILCRAYSLLRDTHLHN
jgi:E3 ubiquitin-protein ligase synoviolin